MSDQVALTLTIALAAVAIVAGLFAVLTRRVVSTPAERTVHAVLHTASLAAQSLRAGLTAQSARGAAPHLRTLTGSDGVALYDAAAQPLALDPPGAPMWTPTISAACVRTAREAIDGRRRVMDRDQTPAVVAQPLLDDAGTVLGALVAVHATEPAPGMLGAIAEVTRYAAGQLQLAELDASRGEHHHVVGLEGQFLEGCQGMGTLDGWDDALHSGKLISRIDGLFVGHCQYLLAFGLCQIGVHGAYARIIKTCRN